uniref:Aminotransferase class I/classII large domain-containing protein n=1 Tax=Fusarium oxysporum (strain Fo5176) TaxID=660025 RepID=A0A0D2XLJ3_FUSOF
MSQSDCISPRGVGFLPDAPKFFDVLNDLWDPETNPEGIVNLGLAENLRAEPHALTYGDGFTGSKLLKEAFCQLLNDYFNPRIPVLPSHLTITPGVGNAIECCAWSLFNSQDQVLIGRPYWTAFNYIFGIRAGKRVLIAYMRLCGKLGLHLIVDEIYALSVFENPEMDDPVPFTSILSLSAEGLMDPRKVHVQWGFSKV